MKIVGVIGDVQHAYFDFLKNTDYPKLESLSPWGKNRFFFSRYFKLIEDWYQTEKIVIEIDHHLYCLDTATAPDFLNEALYLAWLNEALQHEYSV